MSNNSFAEIGKVLTEAKSVILFPHISMDGDALGSCAALCSGLRSIGKDCVVLIEDKIPGNLEFLDKGFCSTDFDVIKEPDVCMCVDCGDAGRFPGRKEKFFQGKTTVCIDHHSTTEMFCDYNYIDSQTAATGELVYHLLEAMGIEPDLDAREAIFAAITTDTGNFQYSNTTKASHEIVANLVEMGLDCNKVSVELYENIRLERIMIENKALATLCTLSGGKGAIAFVTQDMLADTGADSSETEGIVQILRSIAGVEIAGFLKEAEPNKVKVSLRAKRKGDVAAIATKFGGGGHVKAAGCTINASITEAFNMVKAEIEKSLENL